MAQTAKITMPLDAPFGNLYESPFALPDESVSLAEMEAFLGPVVGQPYREDPLATGNIFHGLGVETPDFFKALSSPYYSGVANVADLLNIDSEEQSDLTREVIQEHLPHGETLGGKIYYGFVEGVGSLPYFMLGGAAVRGGAAAVNVASGGRIVSGIGRATAVSKGAFKSRQALQMGLRSKGISTIAGEPIGSVSTEALVAAARFNNIDHLAKPILGRGFSAGATAAQTAGEFYVAESLMSPTGELPGGGTLVAGAGFGLVARSAKNIVDRAFRMGLYGGGESMARQLYGTGDIDLEDAVASAVTLSLFGAFGGHRDPLMKERLRPYIREEFRRRDLPYDAEYVDHFVDGILKDKGIRTLANAVSMSERKMAAEIDYLHETALETASRSLQEYPGLEFQRAQGEEGARSLRRMVPQTPIQGYPAPIGPTRPDAKPAASFGIGRGVPRPPEPQSSFIDLYWMEHERGARPETRHAQETLDKIAALVRGDYERLKKRSQMRKTIRGIEMEPQTPKKVPEQSTLKTARQIFEERKFLEGREGRGEEPPDVGAGTPKPPEPKLPGPEGGETGLRETPEVKRIQNMTFEQFEKEYRRNFDESLKYTPDQAGSRTYMERMALMSEIHPEWTKLVEGREAKAEVTGEPNLREMMDNITRANLERANEIDSVSEGGKQGFYIETPYGRDVYTKAPEGGKQWRVTRIDERGPFGHTNFFDYADMRREVSATTRGEINPIDAKRVQADVQPDAKPHPQARKVEDYWIVPREALEIDPERFQFRMLYGKGGQTGRLSGVQKWSPELAGAVKVWRDPKNGKIYVVDGHNRIGKGDQLGVTEYKVEFVQANNAQEARVKGAISNIAGGNATAFEVAKFLRDTGLTAKELIDRGISLRRDIVRKGQALADLDEAIFNEVVRGEIEENLAVVIGEKFKTPREQYDFLKLMSKSKYRTAKTSIIQEIANDLIRAPKEKEILEDMFGAVETERALMLERAEIADYVKTRLKQDKRMFGYVSKESRAKKLERGGNVIDVDKSGEVATESAQLLEIFDRLRSTAELDHVINKYAKQLAQGGNPNAVKSEAYGEITKTVSNLIRGTKKPIDRPKPQVQGDIFSEAKQAKEKPIRETDKDRPFEVDEKIYWMSKFMDEPDLVNFRGRVPPDKAVVVSSRGHQVTVDFADLSRSKQPSKKRGTIDKAQIESLNKEFRKEATKKGISAEEFDKMSERAKAAASKEGIENPTEVYRQIMQEKITKRKTGNPEQLKPEQHDAIIKGEPKEPHKMSPDEYVKLVQKGPTQREDYARMLVPINHPRGKPDSIEYKPKTRRIEGQEKWLDSLLQNDLSAVFRWNDSEGIGRGVLLVNKAGQISDLAVQKEYRNIGIATKLRDRAAKEGYTEFVPEAEVTVAGARSRHRHITLNALREGLIDPATAESWHKGIVAEAKRQPVDRAVENFAKENGVEMKGENTTIDEAARNRWSHQTVKKKRDAFGHIVDFYDTIQNNRATMESGIESRERWINELRLVADGKAELSPEWRKHWREAEGKELKQISPEDFAKREVKNLEGELNVYKKGLRFLDSLTPKPKAENKKPIDQQFRDKNKGQC